MSPTIIDKNGIKLVLHNPGWGYALSVWNGAGACSIKLEPEEMLSLSKALWYAAKKK